MKKIVCLLLALLVVLPMIASCGGSDDPKTTTTAKSADTTKAATPSGETQGTQSGETTPSGKEEAYVWPSIDMGGEEFFIMERWFGYGKPSIDFTGEVLYLEPEDGSITPVNVAKKEVIEEVQKKFNCKIKGEMYTGENIVATMREKVFKDITSGAAEYDMVFESYYYYAPYIKDGYLYDLTRLDGIDFSRSCWDQRAVEELSICGAQYFGIGDINTYDNDGTFVVLFNKKLYEAEGFEDKYGSPYDMVNNKTWTLDKLGTIAKEATKNISGGEDLDQLDQWGLGSETSNLYLHCLAGGKKIVSKNSNDEPVLTMLDETTYKILTEAVTLYTSGKVLVADDGTWTDKVADIYQNTVTDAFLEGRELFYMCGLLHVPYFRNMDDDFGILPVPLYTETQDRYYSSVSSQTMSCLMIPNHAAKISKNLGYVIQALAELSKEKVTPEYYNKQLKGRDTRDDESIPMLDLIFENRIFDLGTVFGKSWGDADSLYHVLDLNIVSRFEKAADSIEARMEDDVDIIKEMQENQ
ncbi:MAG: extracellular solute-binding protein [Clostridia bacterium]|nr:extracellular solute-binding protein [Clostridia bacterium]